MRSFLLAFFLSLVVVSSGCAETDPVLDVRVPVTYPPKELVEFINARISKTPATGDESLVVTDTGNPLFDGASNSFYRHTGDMPLTRFVLGTLKFDLTALNLQITHPDAMRGPNTESISGPSTIKFDTAEAQKALDGASGAFAIVMQKIPIIFLAGFFSIQLFLYVMILVLGVKKELPNPTVMIIRLLFFFLILWYFRIMVGNVITFSNYVSNAIIPYQMQEAFVDTVVLKTFGIPGDGATIGNLVAYCFRFLGYLSIKILIILRDVLMSLSLILGPFCFSLGYISMFGWGGDIFNSYISGWIQNFVKILFWGPFAAIMIYAMGIISAITGITSLDGYTAAIFGLACLFAAKDVPGLAERFSGIAMTSVLGKLLPAIGGVAAFGGGVAGSGALVALGGLKALGTNRMSSVATNKNLGKTLSGMEPPKPDPETPGPTGTDPVTGSPGTDSKFIFDPKSGTLIPAKTNQDGLSLDNLRAIYKVPEESKTLDEISSNIKEKYTNKEDTLIYLNSDGAVDYGWKGDKSIDESTKKIKITDLLQKDPELYNQFKNSNLHLSSFLPAITKKLNELQTAHPEDIINLFNGSGSKKETTLAISKNVSKVFRSSFASARQANQRLEQELMKETQEGSQNIS